MMRMMKITRTMKMKIRAVLTLIIFLCMNGSSFAENIVETANKDWLELVRQNLSSDTMSDLSDNFSKSEIDYKWERLVKDYEKSPKAFLQNSKSSEAEILSEWWETLGDEILTGLIAKAFESNRSIQEARAKVLEARARAGVVKSNFQPKVTGSGRYTNGVKSYIEEGVSYNDYYIGMDASWELDFFGKNKHALDAAKATLDAEYADLHNAWCSLSAEVAMNYVNLRILQNRLAVARKNMKIQQDILDILESQYNAGLKDALAVQQQKYTLEQTRAEIPVIEQSMQEVMSTISLLTGEIPGSRNELLERYAEIPEVDVKRLIGIPAYAIRQRPDIRAAERRLAAQYSTRKSAEKNLYPSISLAGSIGLESLSTGNLFTSDAFSYLIGPRINIPIFNAGEIRKNIEVQSAVEEQLAAALEEVILQAVKEVHDALTANAQEFVRNDTLKKALISASDTLFLARDKYDHGLTDFSNVLLAQQALYSAEDEYISSKGQEILNLIALFKSLGGGWLPL